MGSPSNRYSDGDKNVYFWQQEDSFDSVTSILERGMPTPYGLRQWADGVIAEFAIDRQDDWVNLSRSEALDLIKGARYRTRDDAAARGSDVHDWAEKFALGIPFEIEQLPEATQPWAVSFMQFIADWRPRYEMTEASVFNRAHGWAGTLDALAFLADDYDLRTLMDTKTVKSREKARVYEKHPLQLAAYRQAEFIGMPDGVTEVPMPPIDRCCILFLFPGGYRLVPVKADEDAYRMFRYVRAVSNWKASGQVGKALMKPKSAELEAAVAALPADPFDAIDGGQKAEAS